MQHTSMTTFILAKALPVKRQRCCILLTLSVTTLLLTAAVLHAQGTTLAPDEQAARRKLAELLENPVANLVSVPIQNNFDFGIGPAQAMRYTLNIQPVIPFTLSADWNLITRTIVPIIYAESPIPGGKNRFGLGDITQSFFLSPQKPVGGLILGAGPVLRYPTASDSALGGEQWGAGPTALVIRQERGWTYGALVNHLWSFAGDRHRSRLNATFLQPVIAYSFKTATTVAVSSESLYDWEAEQWTVPLNLNISQLFKLGKQPIRLTLGGRYYAESPPGGPDWGMRCQVVLPFPK